MTVKLIKPFQESLYFTFINRMNCSVFPLETQCIHNSKFSSIFDLRGRHKMCNQRLIRTLEKSSLKIKLNIPAMFLQGCEWGESQLMQENMVSAPYASALTHNRIS